MSQEAQTNVTKWFPVLLISSVDSVSGVTGKAVGDLTVREHFQGASSQSSYSPSASDWTEAGNGEYWLQIDSSVFTAAGKYQFSIACTGCLTYRFVAEVNNNDIDDMVTNVPY